MTMNRLIIFAILASLVIVAYSYGGDKLFSERYSEKEALMERCVASCWQIWGDQTGSRRGPTRYSSHSDIVIGLMATALYNSLVSDLPK